MENHFTFLNYVLTKFILELGVFEIRTPLTLGWRPKSCIFMPLIRLDLEVYAWLGFWKISFQILFNVTDCESLPRVAFFCH